MRMIWRFAERLEVLGDPVGDFLKTLAYLGGYCTVGQGQRLGLAQSPTRTSAHLKDLERNGFLRRVADYPVVYQVTKSVTRLLGHDLQARRRHTIETVRAKLLAVSFYLDALEWPAEFVFDPQQKIAVFQEYGYPRTVLPPLWGKPFMSRVFLLEQPAPRFCVALVDQSHKNPFMQLWRLVKRFLRCLEHDPTRLQMLVAVGNERRFHIYRRLAANHCIQKLARDRFEIPLKPYRVQTPVPWLHSLKPSGGKLLQ
jgi:hypothetical protein